MNNLIGIAGVFVLTFSLIGLYHIMSAFGRHSKRPNDAHIRPLENPNEQRRTSHDQSYTPESDGSWPRWNGDFETPSVQPDIDRGEDIRRSPLR